MAAERIVKGKRLKKAYEAVEAGKAYPLTEAVRLVKSGATAKFDETVDVAVNLGVDPAQSDQAVRGAAAMPHGLGKTIRVAVFARGDKAEDARKAGADIVGAEDLVEQVEKGKIEFDACVASPDMMVLVGKIGKILGPKGLMPNPKLGTVTPNVGAAVKAAKSGQVEFRTEKGAIIHAGVGKASFEEKALIGNLKAFFDALSKAKPQDFKGIFLEKITLSSTMGPAVKVDPASLKEAA